MNYLEDKGAWSGGDVSDANIDLLKRGTFYGGDVPVDVSNLITNTSPENLKSFLNSVYTGAGAYAGLKAVDNPQDNTNMKQYKNGGNVPRYGLGGDVALGAGQGALGGMALGPWGAAAGAVIGGASALFGGLNQEEETTVEPSRIAGNSPIAGAQNIPTFFKGGMTNAGTSELEQGEVYMTPDGNVQRITDKAPKHGQKAKSGFTGVRMDLPEGTKILSNRNIDPMTGKTFADTAVKDSKFRDKVLAAMDKGSKYAKEASKRNLKNLDDNFKAAYDRQEFAKGGETKKTSMYQGGGLTDNPYGPPVRNFGNGMFSDIGMYNMQHLVDSYGQPDDPYAALQGRSPLAGPFSPSSGGYAPPGGAAGYFDQQPISTSGGSRGASSTKAAGVDPSSFQAEVPSPADMPNITPEALQGSIEQTPINLEAAGASGIVPNSTGAGLGLGQKLSQGLGGIGGVASAIGSLAPTIYNAIQGSRKPTQRDANEFKNPQYNQAINLMANRRFNVEPLLEANRNASAIGRYNLQGAGASAGQQYSGYQALAAQRMRSDAAAHTQKQNIDNQYLAEEAKVRAGLGSEQAQNLYRTDQDNLAAQAARRNYQGTAASQFGQFAQLQRQMQNQRGRDDQLMNILKTNPYAGKWLGLPTT